MELATVTVSKRPSRLSAALGVAAAAAVLVLVFDDGAARLALGIEVVGLLVAGLGAEASVRGSRIAGVSVGLVGAAIALVAVVTALATVDTFSVTLALVPGMVGLFVLAMAVLPVRGHGSRGLVKLGTALVFVGVLTTALFRLVPSSLLLPAAVVTVVAWDASDNAIGMGEQLGTTAATRRPELVHVAGTAAVGVIGVLAARAVGGLTAGGLSLESFVLLLGAVVLLTLALHG